MPCQLNLKSLLASGVSPLGSFTYKGYLSYDTVHEPPYVDLWAEVENDLIWQDETSPGFPFSYDDVVTDSIFPRTDTESGYYRLQYNLTNNLELSCSKSSWMILQVTEAALSCWGPSPWKILVFCANDNTNYSINDLFEDNAVCINYLPIVNPTEEVFVLPFGEPSVDLSEDIFNPALAENSNIELSRYLSTLEGNTVPSFDTVPCEECGYSSSTLYIQIIDVPGEPTILEDEVEVCLDLEFQTFNTEDLIDILSVDTAGVWINTGADTIRLRVNGSTKFVAPDGVVAEGFSHTFAPMMIDGVTEYTIAYVQAQGTTCELVAPITFTGVNCTIYPSVSISETFEVEELPAAWNIQIESFS